MKDMKLRFRVTRVGRKWVYGYIGRENGVFNILAKISKVAFPVNRRLGKDDLFVFHNTTGKIGNKVKHLPAKG